MKTASAKAKGRKLQQWVASKISDLIRLSWGADEPIASREMGQSGTDIRMSAEALAKFPWSVECKNQESWGVHSWVEQAKKNKLKNTEWIIFAKRNRKKTVVILEASVFFKLLELIPGDRKGCEK